MQLRRTITLLLFAAIVVSLSAMPAWRGEIEKKLADGSTILVTLQGDRFLHYYTSEDGRWWKEKNGVLVEIPKADEKTINNQRRVRRRVTQNINQATPLNIAPKGLIILANFNKTYFNSKNSLEGMTEMHNGDNYTYGGATGSARQYFIDQSRGLYRD